MGYGFSHQDVAGVTGSLDNLSQTLLKKRMLAQQDEQMANQVTQQGVQNDLSRQQIGIHRDQLTAENAQRAGAATATADYRKQMLESAQFKQGVTQLNKQVEDIQSRVDAGSLSEEDASTAVKQLHDRIAEAHKLILDNSLLSSYASSGFKVKKGDAKKFAEHPTATMQDLKYATDLESQAADARDAGDEDTATKLEADAQLIRQRLQKTTPPGPMDRTEETVTPGEFGGADKKAVKKVTYTKPGAKPDAAAVAPATGGPKVGDVRKGYRFKGGDPAKPASWEKVN
jgi:hypothetical protein